MGVALFTSPCWCAWGGLVVHRQYLRWVVYTAEDREFFRHEREQYPEMGGVPSIARQLIAEMEPVQDPETAVRLHPDWAGVRFKNGEWIFGRGFDSHWISAGRGTLVLKDSRGRVRVFFGHVCGDNAGLNWYTPNTHRSLDAFDQEYFSSGMFREWTPDP
ncbi:hypothetical protein [Frigoriglobus tundricola]|uniref:hypothetical protein n=1 Tax=Frigoriglobus tundricola TaxID=2774151 RepID=UPI00148EE6E8|nr:hypothetical protein [Frigoriglobus tundricola]